MDSIESYLREHFLSAAQFAECCDVASDELTALVADALVPGPTYRVDAEGNMHSLAFGTIPTAGAPAGQWFNAHGANWVARARQALTAHAGDRGNAALALKEDFHDRYRAALVAEHEAHGPIPGFVDQDNRFDFAAFEQAFPGIWKHFLAGTFGLCVSEPVSETRIAAKEATQARLTRATDNGQRRDYSPTDAEAVRRLIDRYVETSMPFSPAEYPLSSRKRLVEDVLPCL